MVAGSSCARTNVLNAIRSTSSGYQLILSVNAAAGCPARLGRQLRAGLTQSRQTGPYLFTAFIHPQRLAGARIKHSVNELSVSAAPAAPSLNRRVGVRLNVYSRKLHQEP